MACLSLKSNLLAYLRGGFALRDFLETAFYSQKITLKTIVREGCQRYDQRERANIDHYILAGKTDIRQVRSNQIKHQKQRELMQQVNPIRDLTDVFKPAIFQRQYAGLRFAQVDDNNAGKQRNNQVALGHIIGYIQVNKNQQHNYNKPLYRFVKQQVK